jgi:hypothetical protein
VETGSGAARVGYSIRIVMPSTYTADAVLPPDTILAVTDDTGEILTTVDDQPVELIVGIAYELQYASAEIITGTTTAVPRNTRQTIVVPEGEGPIALATLLAASNPVTPNETTLQAVIAYLVENPPVAVYAEEGE